jgi:hypothetical protein
MSDRGLLFLFSILMIAAGIGSAVWLVVTGQAGTVDGLFLVLTALVVAASFGLYAVFLIRRAMEAQVKRAAKAAAPASAKSAAKPATPASVAEV